MAEETVVFCDWHRAKDAESRVTGTPVVVAIGTEAESFSHAPKRVDLCAECDRELLGPVRLLLANAGRANVDRKPAPPDTDARLVQAAAQFKPATPPKTNGTRNGSRRGGRNPKWPDRMIVADKRGRYACPICHRNYGHHATIRTHLRNVHGETEWSIVGDRGTHDRTPTRKPGPRIACPECGYLARSTQGLAAHRRSHPATVDAS